jgi:hypothetical protein
LKTGPAWGSWDWPWTGVQKACCKI